ncbi:hypothetical protein QBC35DRAFT_457009 [Podospora australis]|uniref:Uncharacterized protein n=1 Tax=Podospora australis TaxID=1536484 RepID=A0AAN6WK27_9PEZI|nr:hypothetical protein QBC35DRAFT_457009 [Podospora australis]
MVLLHLLLTLFPVIALCGMADFFTLHSSCNNPAAAVDKLLDDTLNLIDQALLALTVLQTTTSGFPDDTPERNVMRAMHFTFGTKYLELDDFAYDAADLAIIQGRKEWFQTLRNKLTKGHNDQLRPQDQYLTCDYDGTALRFTSNPSDISLSYPDFPNGNEAEFFQRNFPYPFAWIPTNVGYENGWAKVKLWPELTTTGDRNRDQPYDYENTEAFTDRNAGTNPNGPRKSQIVLCIGFYNPSRLLPDLDNVRNDPDNAKGVKGEESINLDDYNSRPGTFIHELCHLVGGDEWLDDNFDYRTRDGVMETRIEPYGALSMFLLANLGPDRGPDVQRVFNTGKNDRFKYPEAYALFAQASYAPNKEWEVPEEPVDTDSDDDGDSIGS